MLLALTLATACSQWVPVRGVRDIGVGQPVRIERNGRAVELDHVVRCDNLRYVVARDDTACADGPSFDIRGARVFVKETPPSNLVGGIVMSVLAAGVTALIVLCAAVSAGGGFVPP